jgi:RNA polymerase sigma factor (sigma-70 family)
VLSDDAVIAYVTAARAAGDPAAAVRGIQLLVYGHWQWVRVRLARKLPLPTVEDQTGDLMVRALKSSFDGGSVGEFRSWLQTIVDRHIADFHRSRKPDTVSLPGQGADHEEHGPDDLAGPSEEGLVETRLVIEQVLSELSAEHRRAVELCVLDGVSASEASVQIEGMTDANAYQVVHRFRLRLREALDAGGG